MAFQFFTMIEELKYFLLGLIQGLAEFFPISSSGHIVLFSNLIDLSSNHPLLLSIVVHFATTLSTIIVYKKRIFNTLKGVMCQSHESVSFVTKIIVSSLPIVIVGILFREKIEFVFNHSTQLVALMLTLTGLMLVFNHKQTTPKNHINYMDALLMGVAQSIAILPGISRSGATISMALLCKIDRKKAAEFSFLMVLLPIIGITIIELIILLSSSINLKSSEIYGLIIAFFSALISGLFACRYMIRLVQNNNLKYFGYYCILVGFFFILLY